MPDLRIVRFESVIPVDESTVIGDMVIESLPGTKLKVAEGDSSSGEVVRAWRHDDGRSVNIEVEARLPRDHPAFHGSQVTIDTSLWGLKEIRSEPVSLKTVGFQRQLIGKIRIQPLDEEGNPR